MKIAKHFRYLILVFLFFSILTRVSSAQTVFGFSDGNLISFDAQTPDNVRIIGAISGLPSDTELLGMDFRPNTGQLFGLAGNKQTGNSFLLVISLEDASARVVGSGLTLEYGQGSIGFDFNPTVDRIRVITSNGNNYRLNPNTGALQVVDGSLSYADSDVNNGATPRVIAGAYTNCYIGTTSTTLYDYDAGLNILVSQVPPNDGVLNTIGSSGLSFDSTAIIDMDILAGVQGAPNMAILVATADRLGSSQLYTINLSTGETTLVGLIDMPGAVEMISFQIKREVPSNIAGQFVFGLTANGMVVTFDSENPGAIREIMSVSGLLSGQSLAGIDSRPNTGELWGLGYDKTNWNARLYIINQTTGIAIPQGAVNINLELGTTAISFDFNPTVDRIRVMGANQKNYRLNPNTGAIAATDGNVNYATGDINEGNNPQVITAAYTNSYLASSTTGLYVYEAGANVFAFQNPPNNGILNTIGSGGFTADPLSSTFDMDIFFDADSRTNTAYLSAESGSTSDKLYTVDLETGNVEEIGFIGNGIAIAKIAVFIDRSFPAEIEGELVYGITQNNYLISFDSDNPSTIRTLASVTGMDAGQSIAGADFRPDTGELWVLGYNSSTGKSRLYTADLNTGLLSAVGPTDIDLELGDGIGVGFDFNPTVDRIRVVAANGKNYRLNPFTGGIAALTET